MHLSKSILFIIISVVFSSFIQAQNLYGAKNGVDDTSDPNRGYSIGKPFKTVTFAAKEVAEIDTIFVKKGIYKSENFGDNATDIYNNEKTVNINNVHGTNSGNQTQEGYYPFSTNK